MPSNNTIDLPDPRTLASHQTGNTGFNSQEARQMLEFCIELNNQDDRNKPENRGIPEFEAKLNNWIPVYDSRVENDPAKNGFGPFNNAWLLLKNQDAPNQYAIAIRGTVSEATSILDDALATTIAAQNGIEFPENNQNPPKNSQNLPITFAVTPRAELHLGFAYGAFTTLFHKEKGILSQLKQLPAGSSIFITGHSQGAAIATIIHAFLHYAIVGENDAYGIKHKFSLKSYFYAQPKPGNAQFALDFARIAASRGAAFVINNNLDPVPQLPLGLETVGEAIADTLAENQSRTRGIKDLLVDALSATTSGVFWIRNRFAEHVGDKVLDLYKTPEAIDTSYFKDTAELADPPVNSLNYALSGNLVPVFGEFKGGNLYPFPENATTDWLLQHHATSYRKLIEQQLK